MKVPSLDVTHSNLLRKRGSRDRLIRHPPNNRHGHSVPSNPMESTHSLGTRPFTSEHPTRQENNSPANNQMHEIKAQVGCNASR